MGHYLKGESDKSCILYKVLTVDRPEKAGTIKRVLISV
jgi:hypothetical protein